MKNICSIVKGLQSLFYRFCDFALNKQSYKQVVYNSANSRNPKVNSSEYLDWLLAFEVYQSELSDGGFSLVKLIAGAVENGGHHCDFDEIAVESKVLCQFSKSE